MEATKEPILPAGKETVNLMLKETINFSDRTNKALKTTKDLNKRLRSVKLLSQKNFLHPTSDTTRRRVGFAITKSTSRSHEVKLSSL